MSGQKLLDQLGRRGNLVDLDANLGAVPEPVGDTGVGSVTVIDENGSDSRRLERFLEGQRLNLVVRLIYVVCVNTSPSTLARLHKRRNRTIEPVTDRPQKLRLRIGHAVVGHDG